MNLIQSHKSFFILFLVTTFNGLIAYDFSKACAQIGLSNGEKNLKVIGNKNSSRSYVTVLKDKVSGKKYILKQLKNASGHPIQVVQEKLGTYVVNWLGLLSQEVIIVPPSEFRKIKILKDQPATLHTFIEEKPIKDIRQFKKLQVRQIKLKSSSKEHGINRSVIKSMAKFFDLAAIVAADTFLGIGDRHRANLLFSKKLQKFWIIDMDYTYHAALVEACIRQVKLLISKGTKLSSEEYAALLRYKKTLEKLYETFTTEKLIELLDEFVDQAGMHFNKNRASAGVSYNSIVKHIKESNGRMKELIALIDTLVSRHGSKKKHK